MFQAPSQTRADATSMPTRWWPMLGHAFWGALATVASPFPLAYWLSLGRVLAWTTLPERVQIGTGILIVDVAWAVGFPFLTTRLSRSLPAGTRQLGRLLAGIASCGITLFFGAQLACTIIQ